MEAAALYAYAAARNLDIVRDKKRDPEGIAPPCEQTPD